MLMQKKTLSYVRDERMLPKFAFLSLISGSIHSADILFIPFMYRMLREMRPKEAHGIGRNLRYLQIILVLTKYLKIL